MNYQFSIEMFPLRFFLVSSQSECFFSITYNHWIADAFAISKLMEVIFAHLNGQSFHELTVFCPSIQTCFNFLSHRNNVLYRYFLISQIMHLFSRAYRAPVTSEEDIECGSTYHIFEQDVLNNIVTLCKAKKISVNDLFVAILAIQFGRITQEKRATLRRKFLKPKRDRVVVGVISNLRKYSQLSLDKCFSLFLGFFYLSFKSPEINTVDELTRVIAAQTRRYKQNKKAVKNYLLFKVQRDLFDKKKNKYSKLRLFRKNTPITVGISNLDLSHSGQNNSIQKYLRFSPTGMICPIVFNMTSFNSYLSLGINFRKASYSLAQVEILKELFVSEIKKLANVDVSQRSSS